MSALNPLRRRAARAIECFVGVNLLHIAVALVTKSAGPPAAPAAMAMGLTLMAAMTIALLILAHHIRAGRSVGITLALLSWPLAGWIVVSIVLLATGDYPAKGPLLIVQIVLVSTLAFAWFAVARLFFKQQHAPARHSPSK